VEIGIASNSGLIRSFTFVHSRDIFLTDTQVDWPKLHDEGTPEFDINEWPESGRLDEHGLAEIYFNGDELSVYFSRNVIAKKLFQEKYALDLLILKISVLLRLAA